MRIKLPVILLLAFQLCACNTTTVHVDTNRNSQNNNQKLCNIDQTVLFNRLARSIGPAQSAEALITSVQAFLEQNKDIWSRSPDNCYLNDVIEIGVPVHGSKPVNMRVYYEFYLYKSVYSGLHFVCVSANTLTQRRHPTSSLKVERFMPVCKIRKLQMP